MCRSQLDSSSYSELKENVSSSSSSSSSSSYSRIGVCLEELTCAVCFKLFKEPVTLTCGHSFCCACMENYWKSCEEATAFACPNCREVFPQKPKLKKSVILSSLVDQIKLRKGEVALGVEIQDVENDALAEKDVNSGDNKDHCEVYKRKASKLRCTNHGKPIQLYCKDDGSFLCLMCMAGEHRDHKFVPLEIAHAELKVRKCKQYFVCIVLYHIHMISGRRKSRDYISSDGMDTPQVESYTNPLKNRPTHKLINLPARYPCSAHEGLDSRFVKDLGKRWRNDKCRMSRVETLT